MIVSYTSDVQFILDRLREDDLSELTRHLNKSFITGPYILPGNSGFMEYDTIEIIVPWVNDVNNFNSICDLVSYLTIDRGYTMESKDHHYGDRRTEIVGNDTLPCAYQWLHDVVSYLVYFYKAGSSRRGITIMFLTKQGGSNGEDLMKQLDVNLTRQYFDGTYLYATEEALSDMEKKIVTINNTSNIVENQDFPAWCQSMSLVLSFIERGFTFEDTDGYVQKLVRQSFQRLEGQIRWINQYADDDGGLYKLNILHYIIEWNNIASATKLPFIHYTVDPDNMTISGVRVGFGHVSTGEMEYMFYSVPSFALHLHDVDIPIHVVHYHELNPQDKKELIVPICPNSMRENNKVIYYLNQYPEIVGTNLVANLIPYSTQMMYSNYMVFAVREIPVGILPRTCLDVAMATDDVDIEEFLKDNDESIILYNGQTKAYGITADQLKSSQRFIPCEGKGKWSDIDPDEHMNVLVAVRTDRTFDIPEVLIEHILSNNIRKYMLVETDYHWRESLNLSVYTSDDGFIGGSANTCNEGSARDIWLLNPINSF